MSYDELCSILGHYWNGAGVCRRCGDRLRCVCGEFVRQDTLSVHFDRCRKLRQIAELPAMSYTEQIHNPKMHT